MWLKLRDWGIYNKSRFCLYNLNVKSLKTHRGVVLTVLIFVICAGLYLWFLQTSAFQSLLSWSQGNLFLFITILIILKVISIVYAPLSGGLMTLAAIPILGWPLAYVVDYAGSMLGGSAAYLIGNKYGLTLIQKLFGQGTADKISRMKINHAREFEGIFIMRLLGSSLSDFICYGAGLFKVRYRNFLGASLVAHPIIGVPTYYLSGLALSGQNSWIGLILLIISLSILYKVRGRYFE